MTEENQRHNKQQCFSSYSKSIRNNNLALIQCNRVVPRVLPLHVCKFFCSFATISTAFFATIFTVFLRLFPRSLPPRYRRHLPVVALIGNSAQWVLFSWFFAFIVGFCNVVCWLLIIHVRPRHHMLPSFTSVRLHHTYIGTYIIWTFEKQKLNPGKYGQTLE